MDQKADWRLTGSLDHELGRGDPFAAAIRGTRMPMVITDPRQDDNPIVFANQAFQTLSGYARDEIVGRNCRFLQGPKTDRETVREIGRAVAAGEDVNVDILNYRKDGSTFWNALFLSPVRAADGEIQFFFGSQLDITDRVEEKAEIERQVAARTAELEEALEARTLLLHEVDHRVKNNLTMIGALLRLQARTLDDPALAATLASMMERVDALATVHRRLYQSDDITRFDVGALVETLARDILGSTGRTNIALATDLEPVAVSSSHASPLGLIVNELLTNAVKHAYADGRGGTLTVTAATKGERGRITVRDDGPGLGDSASQGLGRTLVERLAKQVQGKIDWRAAPGGGVEAVVEFPLAAAP